MEKLFGRETETSLLLAAFDRAASGGNEIFLVAGRPGVGKSTLINEIQKSVAAKQAYFICGKAEQYKHDIPYYPITQALADLAQKVLCEPDAQVDVWKTSILEAVGPNGRLITDLVPDFEHILGPQPDLAPVRVEVAHHRINYIFKEFLKVCATQTHPIVIFADDLQWADSASMSFIRTLSMETEIRYLLIVGAYRDNVVDKSHLLMRTTDDARKNGATITTLTLLPLSVKHVNQMIAGLLRNNEPASQELSEIVHQKTSGNPFFIRQFLKTLQERNVLTLIPESGWTWDMEKVADIRVTDDVVDFMAAKMIALPASTLEVLKISACFGNRFNLAAVAAVCGIAIDAMVKEFVVAVDQGLIFFKADTGIFSHDRIREGVYQLFAKDERIRNHYRIGRYLIENTAEKQIDEEIAEIVNHFNMARELITSADEQRQMARLNRRAGEKSLASGAFESAFHYFKTGIEFIAAAAGAAETDETRSCWQTDYDLTLALYNGGVNAAYLITDYDEVHRLAEKIFSHSKTINDTINARIVRLHTLMAQNKLDEVIQSGLSVLNSLGVVLPNRPTKLHILAELIRTKFFIKGKQPKDFLELPQIKDPAIQAQVDVMANITSAAYWNTPNLVPLIIFQLMRIFARHGNTDFSPYIYAGYGFILCTLGDIDTGYNYGQMALKLIDQVNAPRYKARTVMVFNTLIRHWKEHAASKLPHLLEGYYSGLQQGDLEFAGHLSMVRDDTLFLTGTPLSDLDIELRKSKENLKKIGQLSNMQVVQIFHQVVLNLQGRNGNPGLLIGESYNEEEMLSIHIEAHDKTCLYVFYVSKLILNYLFGNYPDAYLLSEKMMEYIDGAIGSLYYAVSYFYDSLARIAYYPHAGRFLKQKILFRAARNQKKMKKWALHAPENFLHKYYLVEAEIARIKGRDKEAVVFYKKAITGALENKYVQEAALACECLAEFYLDRELEDFAASYMGEARKLYNLWGAHAKVRHLEEKHGKLLAMAPKKQAISGISESPPLPATSGKDRLDITAIMKMSQAISSEIQLDRLLVTLMRVVMENSGAGKALLILNRDERLVVDAQAEANSEAIQVLQSIPAEQCPDLCPGILNYARRTGTPLVIDDAQNNSQFGQDPYIQKNRIRSVLCLPLVRQQRTIGLIYLENNLTPDVFTPDRIEMITLLSAHAANCLENAVFFEATLAAEKQARKQREQYQKLVETMNDGVAIIDPQLHVSYVNPALCRMAKYRAEEIIGRPAIDFLNDENQQKLEYEVSNWADLDRHIFEIDWITKDGSKLSTLVSPKPLYDDNGEFAGFLGIVTDVTELKKAEKEKELAQAQLLQAQKLEAIGTLAGGVAHDFNNYLTTILGSVDLITMKKNLPENLKKHISHIRHAAELSAALTRKLLAFGRVQMLDMTPINLNTVIANIEMMLRRLIGENITLTTGLSPDLKPVTADFGQMEQIIMNLAVNARDAMPEGGTLLLKTANAHIDAGVARKMEHAVPGEFVLLSVEDSGFGMEPEILDKIFDPFFSSKAPGQGTGLGLSVVYGVVTQHHGWISVDSAQEKGTRFHIYLPVSQEARLVEKTPRKETESGVYNGKQHRILLVEDQPEVREVVLIALTESGYIVSEAATIAEAEDAMARDGENFELLFSDVILPDGNGIDFAGQVIRRRPDIKVLLSSGYTEEKSRPDFIAEKKFHFLQKPYPLNQMLTTVQRILSE